MPCVLPGKKAISFFKRGRPETLLLKLIALACAAIPAILFLRAIFRTRPSRVGSALTEAKKQIDFAIYLFIGIMACFVAFGLGRLAWSWWTAM